MKRKPYYQKKSIQRKWAAVLFSLVIAVLAACPAVPILAEEPAGSGPSNGEETVSVPEELGQLYAVSAVLLDGDSGRILFEKNGREARPMASTTKIMTCILALETLDEDMAVTVSEYAASQPKVHLGMRAGEEYRLGDLLYSLMLESHNDSAVAVAEAAGGSVEGFAEMMNKKAREIGCEDTCFLTPNGLDAEKDVDGEKKVHSTTAADLARIMRYCTMESPAKERFREITGTKDYAFSAAGRSFSCYNHNAFLSMMEGAFSGKTGFTGDAGYCYVGALEKDGKTFIVALLACGWPNNKSYKWSDTKKLMGYGLKNYQYREIYKAPELRPVPVLNGIPESGELTDTAEIGLVEVKEEGSRWELLMKEGEEVSIEQTLEESLEAPVTAGQTVGRIVYSLNGETVAASEIRTAGRVEAVSLSWCISKIIDNFLINF
ncbi:D-alanyl-D-alanine carboxypeptidase [Lacrimispora sp. NSJ-141]|uniref:serine-type D-Ala-D-Ala carboxypeptidase n=1 Tax=Lientehia hominis TaxID=2897778 RepID=A0AAP2RGW2_9FIRM|nr:D-alanyl-D-alanine carboxypeptidase family protein [Lientehia hominis]MCD2491179.1 D-alanyl-D-alanine carboxypeptidase [Lientehia hominis]